MMTPSSQQVIFNDRQPANETRKNLFSIVIDRGSRLVMRPFFSFGSNPDGNYHYE
jgi:hypothetical protein